MNKPINVTYETAIYFAFIIAVLLGQRLALVSSNIADILWNYGLWGVYFLMLISISFRSAGRERGVVVSSSLIYGLIVGIFLWTIYTVNEMKSEHAAFNVTMLLGIILFAALIALVSVVVSFIFVIVIRRVRDITTTIISPPRRR